MIFAKCPQTLKTLKTAHAFSRYLSETVCCVLIYLRTNWQTDMCWMPFPWGGGERGWGFHKTFWGRL